METYFLLNTAPAHNANTLCLTSLPDASKVGVAEDDDPNAPVEMLAKEVSRRVSRVSNLMIASHPALARHNEEGDAEDSWRSALSYAVMGPSARSQQGVARPDTEDASLLRGSGV